MKKKLMYVCGAVLAVATLSACGNNKTNETKTNAPKIEKQTKSKKNISKSVEPTFSKGHFKSEYFEINKFKVDYVVKPSSGDVGGSLIVNTTYTLKNISGKTLDPNTEEFNKNFPKINIGYDADGSTKNFKQNGIYVNGKQLLNENETPQRKMAPGQTIKYVWSYAIDNISGDVQFKVLCLTADDEHTWTITDVTKHI